MDAHIDENPLAVVESERELVIRGTRILAIKAYRERTGVSLKDAKTTIESVQLTSEESNRTYVADLERQVESLKDRIVAYDQDYSRTRQDYWKEIDNLNQFRAKARELENVISDAGEAISRLLLDVYGTVSFETFCKLQKIERNLRTGVE